MAGTAGGLPGGGNTPGANLPVVITLPAPPQGRHWAIYDISWSFSAAPAAGTTVKIDFTVAGTAYNYTWYVNAANSGHDALHPMRPVRLPIDTVATITLAAGGGTAQGTMYVDAQAE
jgi:hypothetical protein